LTAIGFRAEYLTIIPVTRGAVLSLLLNWKAIGLSSQRAAAFLAVDFATL
jgi:hypothetical protein